MAKKRSLFIKQALDDTISLRKYFIKMLFFMLFMLRCFMFI